jgi:hypothetical protein
MSKLICKILHGSHLYGTNTENSDTDYKSIFLPDFDDVLLCNVKHAKNESTGTSFSKNGKNDVDNGEFSIHKFVQLLTVGDIMAFDMLYASDTFIVERGEYFWMFEELRKNHQLFISKNISGYIGYVRKQTAKYSAKGSRLAVVREVIKILETIEDENGYFSTLRIEDVKNKLPTTEYSFYDEKGYNIIGKCFQHRDYPENMLVVLRKYFDEYGERAKQAERNEGIDFKAISHAVRACYQLIDLYKHGQMFLPLPEHSRQIVLDIKQSKMNYKAEVEPLIENLHLTVESLAKNSSYPEQVDVQKISTLLSDLLKRAYRNDF